MAEPLPSLNVEPTQTDNTRSLVFRPDDNRSSYTLLVQTIPGADRERLSGQVFTTLQTQVNRTPTNAQAQYQWGRILATQGKLKVAITTYRQTLDLNPYYRDAHIALAIALAASGRQGEALGQLDQLVGRRGQSKHPTYAQSDRLGQLRKAIQSLQYRYGIAKASLRYRYVRELPPGYGC